MQMFFTIFIFIFAVSCIQNNSSSYDSNGVDDNTVDHDTDAVDHSNVDHDTDAVDHSNADHSNAVDHDTENSYVTQRKCNPGDIQKCNYQGPEKTEGKGLCKASTRTCKDSGEWGSCLGEVLPVAEKGDLCRDSIDNDCNGRIDDGVDFDGDGVLSCEDCCEEKEVCPYPKETWDPAIHFCSYKKNSAVYQCDSDLKPNTNAPSDYAKALGLCKTATEDPKSGWGVISSQLNMPDGSESSRIFYNSGILRRFGDMINPKSGSYMLMLTTSDSVKTRYNSYQRSSGLKSVPPSDWIKANNNMLPTSPGCSGLPIKPQGSWDGLAYDPVMLKLRIRVPKSAKSFSFKVYFISSEFPKYVCRYNDFFVALLDSNYSSDNPDLQNPADKNLAMDRKGNAVGINLAMSGLFTVCSRYNMPHHDSNTKKVLEAVTRYCTGKEELRGIGNNKNNYLDLATKGGTGWLTAKGNVVPGEVITLRFAVWDTGDDAWDSYVLIDNFKWGIKAITPGVEK